MFRLTFWSSSLCSSFDLWTVSGTLDKQKKNTVNLIVRIFLSMLLKKDFCSSAFKNLFHQFVHCSAGIIIK